MAKAPSDVRALARRHSASAVDALVKVMQSDEATPAARVSAAIAILDRGWGKPGQPGEPDPDVLDGMSTDELRDLLATVRAIRAGAAAGKGSPDEA